MTTKHLPPLYSVREFAAVVGRSDDTVREWIHQGRLPASQYVDGRYVIHKKATVLRTNTPNDLAGLPPEFVADEYLRMDYSREPEPYRPIGGISEDTHKKVYAPGFERIAGHMSYRELRRKCRIGSQTIEKLRNLQPVQPGVLWRLAQGLEVDVHEFLKKGD